MSQLEKIERLRQTVIELQQALVEPMQKIKKAAERLYNLVYAAVEAAYIKAGKPYGDGDEAMWRWAHKTMR